MVIMTDYRIKTDDEGSESNRRVMAREKCWLNDSSGDSFEFKDQWSRRMCWKNRRWSSYNRWIKLKLRMSCSNEIK